MKTYNKVEKKLGKQDKYKNVNSFASKIFFQ